MASSNGSQQLQRLRASGDFAAVCSPDNTSASANGRKQKLAAAAPPFVGVARTVAPEQRGLSSSSSSAASSPGPALYSPAQSATTLSEASRATRVETASAARSIDASQSSSGPSGKRRRGAASIAPTGVSSAAVGSASSIASPSIGSEASGSMPPTASRRSALAASSSRRSSSLNEAPWAASSSSSSASSSSSSSFSVVPASGSSNSGNRSLGRSSSSAAAVFAPAGSRALGPASASSQAVELLHRVLDAADTAGRLGLDGAGVDEGRGCGVYGEITQSSMMAVLAKLADPSVCGADNKLSASSHFVDMGSGFGKMVFAASLLYGAQATGIELVSSRHDAAVAIQAKHLFGSTPGSGKISLRHGDITGEAAWGLAHVSSAVSSSSFTHVYAFDAAFNGPTRDLIAQLLQQHQEWRVFVSFRSLGDWNVRGLRDIALIGKVQTSMCISGAGHTAFIYQRQNAPKHVLRLSSKRSSAAGLAARFAERAYTDSQYATNSSRDSSTEASAAAEREVAAAAAAEQAAEVADAAKRFSKRLRKVEASRSASAAPAGGDEGGGVALGLAEAESSSSGAAARR